MPALVMLLAAGIPGHARAEDAFRIVCRAGGRFGSGGYQIHVQPPLFLSGLIDPAITLETPYPGRMTVAEYSGQRITVHVEVKLPGLPMGHLTLSISRETGLARFLLTSRPVETRQGVSWIEAQYALAGPANGSCHRLGTKF